MTSDFDIAMTYGARGTMAKALEQLGTARQLERRGSDAVAAGESFEHLMSVVRNTATTAEPTAEVAPGPLTAPLHTPMTGVVASVMQTVLASRESG